MHGNTAVVNNLDKNEGSRFQAHLDLSQTDYPIQYYFSSYETRN